MLGELRFDLNEISIEIVANKTDKTGNQKLSSFGLKGQKMLIKKEIDQMTMNMFGITLGVFNSAEEIYKFLAKTSNTGSNIIKDVER